MTEPDFNLEGDLDYEESTGKVVFPGGCDTDAQRIAHMEYRLEYLQRLHRSAMEHEADERDIILAINRTNTALAAAKAAQGAQN